MRIDWIVIEYIPGAGAILREPNEAGIMDFLSDGKPSELWIKVLSHRRNSLGPLYFAIRRPHGIAPGAFMTAGKEWADAYRLMPFGLIEPVQLV